MKAALQVIAHLERAEVACALIGGVALGVHGVARATLDTDLLVDAPVVSRLPDTPRAVRQAFSRLVGAT